MYVHIYCIRPGENSTQLPFKSSISLLFFIVFWIQFILYAAAHLVNGRKIIKLTDGYFLRGNHFNFNKAFDIWQVMQCFWEMQ